jgi:hypothetical protein
MNKREQGVARRTILMLLYIATLFSSVIAMAEPADAHKIDAHKIMEGVYGQDKNHDFTMKADFQVFDKQGQSTKKEFTYLHFGVPGDSKTLVAFTAPKEIRGVVLLSINQRGTAASQYVYMPATQRVRSVVQQDRSARFIGTDFTFEDINERVLDDFSYKLMGDLESIDGHKTYKLEANPVEQGRSQYSHILYWVAKDVPVILFAEFYDAQGNKIRVLHATQLKRENGVWGARHTEMQSIAEGTRTILTINGLKFNTKPDEKLFTPQGMAGVLGTSAGK